ncbi:hypothetical protein [Polaribacter ponticola]|uniref:Tail specific protease N-terminal domain-containing protein n=1 Tax=Polaribacter ponticola TaxID=2978475 RepID=A0ABT5S5Y9_9FLAO|nr:hypothetical protein [Polaribacter sp. MSW5]MDD7913521.1 hypothetical protein [Polaribacter sp. MSW5]
MMTKFKFTTIFIALAFLANSFTINATDKNTDPDPEKDKILVYVLKNILTRGHFVIKDMNDDFSEHVYHSFIEGLDPNKRYFTQQDLKEFSQYKYEIDNQLLQDDLTFYNLVYNRFLDKIKNAKSYYGDLLAQPFNFKKNEIIDLEYDKIPFAKNDNELIDYWRKQLKLQTLSRVQEQTELQNEKLKKDRNFKVKTFKLLEKKLELKF